ncbi:hypothetical protein [Marinitenerispora sediminis]|uniref:hypothetical protein n=1 Tax=Marinitenerispora sediminis TaxID=1931232 RepID=UPI000DF16DA2|nr:hypothetical protein [Marinitenerispora sediminis]RCV53467.1 hypothetical protein DEF23_17460 [Marinitenerispora sediminis]
MALSLYLTDRSAAAGGATSSTPLRSTGRYVSTTVVTATLLADTADGATDYRCIGAFTSTSVAGVTVTVTGPGLQLAPDPTPASDDLSTAEQALVTASVSEPPPASVTGWSSTATVGALGEWQVRGVWLRRTPTGTPGSKTATLTVAAPGETSVAYTLSWVEPAAVPELPPATAPPLTDLWIGPLGALRRIGERPREWARPRALAGVTDLYTLTGSGTLVTATSSGVRYACVQGTAEGDVLTWRHPYHGDAGWPVAPGMPVYLRLATTGASTIYPGARLRLLFADQSGAPLGRATSTAGAGEVSADAPPGAVLVSAQAVLDTSSAVRVIGAAELSYAPPTGGLPPLGDGCPTYSITSMDDAPSWLPYRSIGLEMVEVRSNATR